MSELSIGMPYISKGTEYSRLISKITTNKESFELWYEVHNDYADYLCCESSDAFLVAMLPYAMKNKLNIVCEGTISSKLYFNLCYHLMPIYEKHSKIFSKVSIKADNKTTKVYDTALSNATGISCGVDSLYTIQSTQAIDDDNYKLSHLTFFNVGSHKSTVGFTPQQSEQLYKDRLNMSKNVADIIGLPLIDVNSNLGNYLDISFGKIHHFCSFSAVLALQKLFSNYYYSSGYDIKMFSIEKCDIFPSYYEPLLAEYLSTETTEFFISGLEKTRTEKIKSIADSEIAQNHLNVCFNTDKNCGGCSKCVRTQFALYSIGKLEDFKNVFDINNFYSNFDYYADHLLKHQNTSNFAEIIDEMKKNNIKLSPKNRIKKLIYSLALRFRA